MRPHLRLLVIPLLCLSGCVYAPLELGLDQLGKVQEVAVTDGDEAQKLLMIRIDGEITSDEGGLLTSTPSTLAQVRRDLDLARQDDDIRGILMRIDSTGGGVTPSDLILHEVVRWKQETGKPVVAWLADTAASGGYYVALGADAIIAAPTCITGSIGVVAVFPQVAELGDKIGVHVEIIKSGANKDLGSPFRPMSPEEEALLQDLIDRMYQSFVDAVLAARARTGLTRETLLPLADGRVLTAAQAEEKGLIDGRGYLEDAVRQLAGFAHLEDPMLVVYERRSLGAAQPTVYSRLAPALDLGLGGRGSALDRAAHTLLPGSGPVMRYQWLPGRQ